MSSHPCGHTEEQLTCDGTQTGKSARGWTVRGLLTAAQTPGVVFSRSLQMFKVKLRLQIADKVT